VNAPRQPAGEAVDRDAIRVYCEVVFGYLEGLVPIRLLAETGTGDRKPRFEFPRVDRVMERLLVCSPRVASEGLGVFVVPGTVVKAGSARADDVVQCGTILVDLDDGDIKAKREYLAVHLGAPSPEVASGGTTDGGEAKLHLYWRLTGPADGDALGDVTEIRRLIAEKVGGDPSFGSLHQSIRVAGTIHGKHGRQSSVRLIEHPANEYELCDLREAAKVLPPMPGLPNPNSGRRTRIGPTARQLATTRVRAAGQDGITRFDALSSVIGHWLRNARTGSCSIEEAWRAVEEHNAAMVVPPWDG
jgi:hypothetical protein